MSQKVPHEKSLRGDIAVDTIVQSFGQLVPTRIGLGANVRHRSVAALNRMLAHTLLLRDLYKKSHWHTAGATFYQLHLLFDRHAERQTELADVLAERVQTLGGVSLALARDLAQESRLSRASRDREAATAMLHHLCDAHELILVEARSLARQAAEDGDDGTNDVLISEVVRTNELQCWFVAEHLGVKNSTADAQA